MTSMSLGRIRHDFPLLLDVEHAPLAIDKLLSHSCGRDQTGGAATPREEIPHNHQVPEFIAIAPLPTESATNSQQRGGTNQRPQLPTCRSWQGRQSRRRASR